MKTSLFSILLMFSMPGQVITLSSAVNNLQAAVGANSAHKPGELIIEKATITSQNGQMLQLDLGTLFVPENRHDPKSRIIGVGFARVRASQPTNVPPTFHLPGGPGGSFLNGLKPGDNGKKSLSGYIEYYRSISDVVFVDQRGASERGDVLKRKYQTEYALDQAMTNEQEVAAFSTFSKEAVEEYTRRGFDLRGYDVKECAEDVNDLRKALGYRQITLIGQSFGSQWSFAVMRLHPEIVARALLSGVEPLDCGYDMPSHVFAAVRRMWYEAEKDRRFKPYLPPGGFIRVARDVMQRLEHSPVRVTVKDAKTNEPTTITLGAEDLRRMFLAELKSPAFLLSLYYEHYEAWAQAVVNDRTRHETDELIIGPLIDTSLGVSLRRAYLLETDPAVEFLGQWDFKSYMETGDVWPTDDVGDDFRQEVVNQIPVVFVEGDWDTLTPIENTFSIAPFFRNGHVLIVEHGRHTAMKKIEDESPETLKALLEFVRTGVAAKLPSRISLPVPKFDQPEFQPPRPAQN
ncbi:MAG: alpha/beta hydrolase [Pyrinomonadaceae bacterium]